MIGASSHNIVRPAREIEAPAAWSYKSSPSSRVRCQWDGVPGPLLSVHQLAVPSDHETAQDKGSCLPLADPGASATASGGVQLKREGNAGPEAHAPATAGPGVRSGQCLMVRAWPAGATFTPVVPTMLTSEREPAALESEPGDDRVTRLSATRRPAFLPLAPPMPGRLNHPLAAGPESVLVGSVGATATPRSC